MGSLYNWNIRLKNNDENVMAQTSTEQVSRYALKEEYLLHPLSIINFQESLTKRLLSFTFSSANWSEREREKEKDLEIDAYAKGLELFSELEKQL